MSRTRRSISVLITTVALVAAGLVPPFSQASYAAGPVSMPVRPFAINPATMHQITDGFFETGLDDQIIGLFLLNQGSTTVHNVNATAAFAPSSDIVLTDSAESFGSLPPGVPVFGTYRAKFGAAVPDKHTLTLSITGDGFAGTATRAVFVTRIESDSLDPSHWVMHAPEGTIDSLMGAEFGGTNLGAIATPKSWTWTVDYTTPYAGKFGPIPYGDPWWKAFGLGFGLGGCAAWATGAIVKYCGDEKRGEMIKDVGQAGAAAGALVAAADVADPFRRGQAGTSPGAGETTLREKVDVSVVYDTTPVVGKKYTGKVTWTYTRTTNVTTYTFGVVNEAFVNDLHSSVSKQLAAAVAGPDLLVKVKVNITPSTVLKSSDGFVAVNIFKASDTNLATPLKNVILRDDGHGGDATAGDGLYTARFPRTDLPNGVSLSFYGFGYDVNNAAANLAPEVAAQEIGGVLMSPPAFTETCGIPPDLDPVYTVVTRDEGKPVTNTFTGLPGTDTQVTVINGTPGISKIRIKVNSTTFKERHLEDGETRVLDISSAVVARDRNTVSITALGRRNGTAVVVIGPPE